MIDKKETGKWIEEKIGALNLTEQWDDYAEAHYNKGYADAMLEVLNHIKLGGKDNE